MIDVQADTHVNVPNYATQETGGAPVGTFEPRAISRPMEHPAKRDSSRREALLKLRGYRKVELISGGPGALCLWRGDYVPEPPLIIVQTIYTWCFDSVTIMLIFARENLTACAEVSAVPDSRPALRFSSVDGHCIERLPEIGYT
jgi:hypothetical protein